MARRVYFAAGLWERYGTDYLYEEGKWLIHHDQVCLDAFFLLDSDSNWATNSYKNLREGTLERIKDSGRWERNQIGWIHFHYSPIQPVQDTYPWPEPYETFYFENIYGTIKIREKSTALKTHRKNESDTMKLDRD